MSSGVSPPARGGAASRATVAVVLLLAGLASWALFRIVSGTEHHAYSAGSVAPSSVAVTDGRTYDVSIRGGVDGLTARHELPNNPQCSWSSSASGQQLLQVTPSGSDKATNVVGTFSAPITGSIHVACTGWGPVFVDDADHVSGDPAGYLLVIAIIALTIGAGLGLSAMYTASRPVDTDTSPGGVGKHDQVQGLVHVGDIFGQHGEVSRADGGDVPE